MVRDVVVTRDLTALLEAGGHVGDHVRQPVRDLSTEVNGLVGRFVGVRVTLRLAPHVSIQRGLLAVERFPFAPPLDSSLYPWIAIVISGVR